MKRFVKLHLAALCAAGAAVFSASAAPAQTVDGSFDMAEYGAGFQVLLQTTETEFGNNTDPVPGAANGSELDNMSVADDGSNLYIGLAGNLESNFNHLILYIDVDNNPATGASTDPGGWGPFGNSPAGLILPIGAELGFIFNCGDTGSGMFQLFVEGAVFDAAGAVSDAQFIGGTAPAIPFVPLGGLFSGYSLGSGTHTSEVTLDNSNTGGVIGGTGFANPGDAAAVTTGLEFSIPVSLLDDANGGPIGGDIGIFAIIGNTNGTFLSNQAMPGLGTPTGNLGDPSAPVDLSGEAPFAFSSSLPVELSAFSLE